MPAAYAHERFGNEVLARLSESSPDVFDRCIANYTDLIHIGFQGPDFLFFYYPALPNPVVKEGIRIHDAEGLEFFSHAVSLLRYYRRHQKRERYDAAFAYLAGVVCHFSLDCTCHPFVNEFESMHAEDTASFELPVSHAEIEAQFERYLMKQDGRNPVTVDITAPFHPTRFAAAVAAPFYPAVPKYRILPALDGFVLNNHILYCPGDTKRTVISSASKFLHIYPLIHGHMIPSESYPVYALSNQRLGQLFRKALPRAVRLITELSECTENSDFLNDPLLLLNFSGKEEEA
ncbi:MAG: zinc dependent phospholipase C family protein [Eubacterium sp.]|nr:zinc dependent phospholipase C family protein [Eubacterium sp.]